MTIGSLRLFEELTLRPDYKNMSGQVVPGYFPPDRTPQIIPICFFSSVNSHAQNTIIKSVGGLEWWKDRRRMSGRVDCLGRQRSRGAGVRFPQHPVALTRARRRERGQRSGCYDKSGNSVSGDGFSTRATSETKGQTTIVGYEPLGKRLPRWAGKRAS